MNMFVHCLPLADNSNSVDYPLAGIPDQLVRVDKGKKLLCVLPPLVFRGREEPSLVAEDLFRKEPQTRRRPVDILVTPDSFSHEIVQD
jgi:hypothetical protein